MRNSCSVLAFGVLAVALQIELARLVADAGKQTTSPNWLALLMVVAVFVLSLTGACTRRVSDRANSRFVLNFTLLAVLSIEFLLLLVRPPSVYRTYEGNDAWLAAFRIGVVALAMVAASYAWPAGRWARLRPALFLGLYAILGGSLILGATMEPRIDVWQMQQHACGYLLDVKNPYANSYPHHFGERAREFLAAELLEDGRIRSYPYPPLNLLLTVPGYLLGDVRWSFLAAFVGSAAAMLAAARRAGLPPGHPAELAALTIGCSPAGFIVLELSWTEPFLALAFALAMWGLAAGKKSGGLAWGGTAFLKQYGILMMPSAWASGRIGVQPLLVGFTVSALITLPFLAWDPSAFWLGTVTFHTRNVFRGDGLSILAAIYLVTGYQLSAALGFIVAAGVIALLLFRQTPGLTAVPLGVAATLIAFFLFNKGAALNYYWLIGAVLALAVVLSAAEIGENNCVEPGRADNPATGP